MEKKIAGIRIIEENWPQPSRFLRLQWLRVVNVYDDGTTSKPYNVDMVHRPAYDSISVTLYSIDKKSGIPFVAVRTALRPGIYFRKREPLPLKDSKNYLWMKESVAGSIEKSDSGIDGINNRIISEIREETGFCVQMRGLKELGGGFFPSHGQSTEKIHMRRAEVDISQTPLEPDYDSPMEESARLDFYELPKALEMCHNGEIEDPKLEIGFRRLASAIGFIPELSAWKDQLPEHLRKNYSSLGLS